MGTSKAESMYAEVVAIGKYLSIHKEECAGGPTTRYRVMAKKPHSLIGWIRWYGPWREWCFLPCQGTVWSESCMKDVIELVKRLNIAGTVSLIDSLAAGGRGGGVMKIVGMRNQTQRKEVAHG